MHNNSNITLGSNIYYRTDLHIENDIDFVQNVSGYGAIRRVKANLNGVLSKARLTDAQIEEQKNNIPCLCATNGEVTHGPVLMNGKIEWVCRCEYEDCERFYTCEARKTYPQIKRNEPLSNDIDEEEVINTINYDYLGLNIADESIIQIINHINIDDEFDYELTINTEDDDYEIQEVITGSKFESISEPSCIINSEISSKILVNAGPGTGKTYTVIHRLIYLLKNELAEPENILVLSYTRAAKAVILERLENEIKEGKLPVEAVNIRVVTFDSMATQYLDATDEEFESLGYDERIRLFNEKINKELFEDFEYLIIDEIQDLVNERAQMVLHVLKNMHCGFLILGDICQAIYDYECDTSKTIDSVEFYNLLYSILPKETRKYELTKNNRQQKELSIFANNIRQALLNYNIKEQNEFVSLSMSDIEIVQETAEKFIPIINKGTKTAILCRNNGEAEYVSSILLKKGIKHNLLRGNNQSININRWFADMFWDYVKPKIGKDEFIERYIYRINENTDEAETKFYCLYNLIESNYNEIKLDNLIRKLNNIIDIPKELSNGNNDELTVSTIHKAKGREFDKVYLLDNTFNINMPSSEEARVRYVAVTRPKSELKKIKKQNNYEWYFKKTGNGRALKTKIKPYYKNQKYCTNVALGLRSDVDKLSFVSNEFSEPLYKQQYISEQIKIMDKVEVKRNENNIYYIYHKDEQIGSLSHDIYLDFWNAIRQTDDRRNLPLYLYDIYVTNIVSIVNTRFDEQIPLRFRESKNWLGIEITGFPKIKYIE